MESCDPAIPLLDTHPKNWISQKDTYKPMFIATLFIIAKRLKLPVSINKAKKKVLKYCKYNGVQPRHTVES